MTLTCLMVTEHRKCYLKMSAILSMPIHWLCSRITSKYYTPMSPRNRNVKHFDFDLTCDVTGDPEVMKICFLRQFFQGFQMPLEFLESVQ